MKLQYAVVSVIALASIVWLGIQIFPVILPLLESSSKFLLKELLLLRDWFSDLLEIFLSSLSKLVSNAITLSTNLMFFVKTWLEDSIPILLSQLSKIAAQLGHIVSSFIDFLKTITFDMKGWIGGSMAILVYGLLSLNSKV